MKPNNEIIKQCTHQTKHTSHNAHLKQCTHHTMHTSHNTNITQCTPQNNSNTNHCTRQNTAHLNPNQLVYTCPYRRGVSHRPTRASNRKTTHCSTVPDRPSAAASALRPPNFGSCHRLVSRTLKKRRTWIVVVM